MRSDYNIADLIIIYGRSVHLLAWSLILHCDVIFRNSYYDNVTSFFFKVSYFHPEFLYHSVKLIQPIKAMLF